LKNNPRGPKVRETQTATPVHSSELHGGFIFLEKDAVTTRNVGGEKVGRKVVDTSAKKTILGVGTSTEIGGGY